MGVTPPSVAGLRKDFHSMSGAWRWPNGGNHHSQRALPLLLRNQRWPALEGGARVPGRWR